MIEYHATFGLETIPSDKEESPLFFEVDFLFNRDLQYRSGVGNFPSTTPSFFVWAAATEKRSAIVKKRVEYNFPFSVACDSVSCHRGEAISDTFLIRCIVGLARVPANAEVLPLLLRILSSQNSILHVSVDIGQAEVSTLESHGQLLVIDPEQM